MTWPDMSVLKLIKYSYQSTPHLASISFFLLRTALILHLNDTQRSLKGIPKFHFLLLILMFALNFSKLSVADWLTTMSLADLLASKYWQASGFQQGIAFAPWKSLFQAEFLISRMV